MIFLIIIILIILIFCLFSLFLSCNVSQISNKKEFALKYIPEKYYLKSFVGTKKSILDKENLNYPMIIKPNTCSSKSANVFKVTNYEKLGRVLDDFPNNDIMVQEYDDSRFEGSILYERYPFFKKGRIINIVKKEIVTNEEVRHNLRNAVIKNISDIKTDKLEEAIDEISNKIPGFYVGRYDIKFKSIEDLKEGNFKIMELNGCFGIDLTLYTNDLKDRYFKPIPGQLRWIIKRVFVGFINILNPFNWYDIILSRFYEIYNFFTCPNLREYIYM